MPICGFGGDKNKLDSIHDKPTNVKFFRGMLGQKPLDSITNTTTIASNTTITIITTTIASLG